MAKKVNIIELTVKEAGIYSVGVEGGDLVDNARVERIIYEQHGYNKGKQGSLPAYVVFFEGTNIRKVVPQDRIVEFAVEFTEEETAGEIAPDLPE